jgi:hypothetical protein
MPNAHGAAPRIGRVIISKPQLRSDSEAAAQEAICALCKWNINGNWICEHVDAKCCSGAQRRIGGLKEAIRRVGFRCPLE